MPTRAAAFLCLVLVALLPSPSPAEPRPPELLTLEPTGDGRPPGPVSFEAVLHPRVDGEVELEILRPASLRFPDGGRVLRHRLARGDAPLRIPFTLVVGTETRAVLRVHLLDAQGRRTASLDRQLAWRAAAAVEGAPARVPRVQVLEDGTRIVEYGPARPGDPAPPGPPPPAPPREDDAGAVSR